MVEENGNGASRQQVTPQVPKALADERSAAPRTGVEIPATSTAPSPVMLGIAAALIILGVGAGFAVRWLLQSGGESGGETMRRAAAVAETPARDEAPPVAAPARTPTRVPTRSLAPTSTPRPIPPTATPSPGSLKVNWEPWATVVVEGHGEKTTPATFHGLAPGRYRVTVTNPELGRTVEQVTVQPGREAVLTGKFEQPGTLNVNAVPWATVWVNGEERGSTPVSLTLAPGTYEVFLDRAGDRSARATYTVTVDSGTEQKIAHQF